MSLSLSTANAPTTNTSSWWSLASSAASAACSGLSTLGSLFMNKVFTGANVSLLTCTLAVKIMDSPTAGTATKTITVLACGLITLMCLPVFQERNNQPTVAIETDAPPPPALSEEENMVVLHDTDMLLNAAEHFEAEMQMTNGHRLDLIEDLILEDFTAEQIADLYLHKVLNENGQRFDRGDFIELMREGQENLQTQYGRKFLEYLTQRYHLG